MDRDNDSWVAGLKAENVAVLSELRTALLRNLRSALRNRPGVDASFCEDVVQDTVIRILSRLHQFRGRSLFLTWATTIAIRVALSELRRSRWRDKSLSDIAADGHVVDLTADSSPSPDALMERRGVVEEMLRLINQELTERQRMALLAELRGMPQDEIARHLGSNRNAIYKLTHDARKKLRHRLEAAGYTTDDVLAMTTD